MCGAFAYESYSSAFVCALCAEIDRTEASKRFRNVTAAADAAGPVHSYCLHALKPVSPPGVHREGSEHSEPREDRKTASIQHRPMSTDDAAAAAAALKS